MSKCISLHGEYSDHERDPAFLCTLCGVFDEDAASAAAGSALAYIDKAIDNVIGVPDSVWRSAEVVEMLRELRGLLTPEAQGSGSGG